jgi:hypothetical protein
LSVAKGFSLVHGAKFKICTHLYIYTDAGPVMSTTNRQPRSLY